MVEILDENAFDIVCVLVVGSLRRQHQRCRFDQVNLSSICDRWQACVKNLNKVVENATSSGSQVLKVAVEGSPWPLDFADVADGEMLGGLRTAAVDKICLGGLFASDCIAQNLRKLRVVVANAHRQCFVFVRAWLKGMEEIHDLAPLIRLLECVSGLRELIKNQPELACGERP